MARGLSNDDIAAELVVAQATVEDPREPGAREARRGDPGAGGRARLRARAGPARRLSRTWTPIFRHGPQIANAIPPEALNVHDSVFARPG